MGLNLNCFVFHVFHFRIREHKLLKKQWKKSLKQKCIRTCLNEENSGRVESTVHKKSLGSWGSLSINLCLLVMVTIKLIVIWTCNNNINDRWSWLSKPPGLGNVAHWIYYLELGDHHSSQIPYSTYRLKTALKSYKQIN